MVLKPKNFGPTEVKGFGLARYSYTSIRVHQHTCMYASNLYTRMYMHMHIYVYIYLYVHKETVLSMYMYM